jgi:ATP-binding cassette subfamily B protein
MMIIRQENDVHHNRRDLHNLKSILPYLKEFMGRALFALLCLILAKAANIGVPVVLKDIVDSLDGSHDMLLVLPLALLLGYGALRLASSLFNELRDSVFARVRYRAMRRLSTRVLTHLHSLSLAYHLDRKTGAISRDLERGTRSVGGIMNFMVFSIIPVAVEFLLVAILLLGNYNIAFTLVTFGTVAIYIGFTIWVTEWRMDFRHEMNRLDSKANSHAIDSLMNYETVKYFNNEALELKRYDKTLNRWEDIAVKSYTSMALLNFGQATIIALGVTAIMFFATQGVVDKEMSIGDLVMVNALMLQLFIPLGALGIIYRQFKYTLADMDLVFKLLEQEPEIQDVKSAPALRLQHGNIEFRQVDFSYQAERQILKDISFSLHAGQTFAVVGHSGAGKSTLSRLLFRFYDCNRGAIYIDQQNIKDISQDSLRQAIAIVPQDTVLFNESIYYNIHYGNPSASKEAVIEAAKMAQIYDFIEALPKQWDTVVGERGLKLSGGEKQRVAIARAIIKQPMIMVFDEATSSLDSETEAAIQKTLKTVSQYHTTLIIAHRLSTIIDADKILVMEAGRIIEMGTHQELLAQTDSHYQHMWHLQYDESR